jgi:hypothetical protein
MAPKRKAAPKTKVAAEPETLPDLSGITIRRTLKNGKNRIRRTFEFFLPFVPISPTPQFSRFSTLFAHIWRDRLEQFFTDCLSQ